MYFPQRPFHYDSYYYQGYGGAFKISKHVDQKKKLLVSLSLIAQIANYQLRDSSALASMDDINYRKYLPEFVSPKNLLDFGMGATGTFALIQTKKFELGPYAEAGLLIVTQPSYRLNSGFSFYESIGLSVSYQLMKGVFITHRFGIRHVSNANLNGTNRGINSGFFSMEFRL
jgi:hypothetical protein